MINDEKLAANGCKKVILFHKDFIWVSCGSKVSIYDGKTRESLGVFTAHENNATITHLASVSPHFLWTFTKSEVKIWEAQSIQELRVVKTMRIYSNIISVFHRFETNALFTGDDEGSIIKYNPLTGDPEQELLIEMNYPSKTTVLGIGLDLETNHLWSMSSKSIHIWSNAYDLHLSSYKTQIFTLDASLKQETVNRTQTQRKKKRFTWAYSKS